MALYDGAHPMNFVCPVFIILPFTRITIFPRHKVVKRFLLANKTSLSPILHNISIDHDFFPLEMHFMTYKIIQINAVYPKQLFFAGS